MLKKLIGLKLNLRNFSSTSLVKSKKIGVIGAPFCDGQPKRGTELGPSAMRKNGLIKILNQNNFKINDYGDLEFKAIKKPQTKSLKVKNIDSVLSAAKLLSDKVHQAIKENDLCLTIGGDHSLAFGTINGHARASKKLAVLWIDAHADINSVQSTVSGNAHGMPVSFLVDKIGNQFNIELKDQVSQLNLLPCIRPEDIVFIGLRDVENTELSYLKEFKIEHFKMKDINQMGIDKVLKLSLDALSIKDKDLHVSFDVDSVDPKEIVSTGTPVKDGLSSKEAYQLAEQISETKKLRGLDIVEINPLIGTKEEVSTNNKDFNEFNFKIFRHKRDETKLTF